MFENLLMTKFHSPPIHPRSVVRDRLIKQLNIGMEIINSLSSRLLLVLERQPW